MKSSTPPKNAKKGLLFSLNEVKQLSYIHTTSHCSVPYVAPHLTFQFIFHFHPELTPIINFCPVVAAAAAAQHGPLFLTNSGRSLLSD